MRGLNALMRHLKKTIILVSHINQKATGAAAIGVAKINGSGGVPAAATKLLEFSKLEGEVLQIQEWGSRFTKTPDAPHQIVLDNLRLKDWDGRAR